MGKNDFSKGFSAVAIIIIGVIILAGIGAFTMMRRSSTSAPEGAMERSSDTATEEAVPVGETTSTLPDIIGRGQSLECDFTLPSSEGQPSPFGTGKLYTTGSNGRSMMTANTSGMSMEANAIYKDETAYTWITAAGTTMGFKFDKDKMNEMSKDLTPQQIQQGEQFRAKMIFNCRPWTPDPSKFVLPTGVEFK